MDRYLVTANYREATKIAKKGAKAYVLWMAGDGESVNVLVRSRGGRHVEKWERVQRLTNFRIKTVVEKGCPPRAWRLAVESREDLAGELNRCVTASPAPKSHRRTPPP